MGAEQRRGTSQLVIPQLFSQMAIHAMDNTSVISWKFVVFGAPLICTDTLSDLHVFSFADCPSLSRRETATYVFTSMVGTHHPRF